MDPSSSRGQQQHAAANVTNSGDNSNGSNSPQAEAPNPAPTAAPASAAGPSVVRRRNRALAACEPCRRAKLRCDHNLPACSRCIKKNMSFICVYTDSANASLDAPFWTFESRLQDVQSRLSSLSDTMQELLEANRQKKTQEDAPRALSPPAQFNFTIPQAEIGEFSDMNVVLGGEDGEDGSHLLTSKQPNYFGPTSWMNVMQEMNAEAIVESALKQVPDAPYSGLSHKFTGFLSRDHNAKAWQILSNFPPKPICDKLVDHYFSYVDPFMHVLNRSMFLHLYKTLWDENPGLGSLDGLTSLTQQLEARQNARDHPRAEFDLSTFFADRVGKSVKWSTLGLVAGVLSMSCSTLDNSSPIVGQLVRAVGHNFGPNAKTCTDGLQKLLEGCLDLGGCLQDTGLESITSLYLYQALENISGLVKHAVVLQGMLVQMLLTSGMHREPTHFAIDPAMGELRRRLAMSVYIQDIHNSLAAGRPPALRMSYSDFFSPLDWDDDDALNNISEIEVVGRNADRIDYNEMGRESDMTFMLCQYQMARAVEKVLETTITPATKQTLTFDAFISLFHEVWNAYHGLPQHMQFTGVSAARPIHTMQTVLLYITTLKVSCHLCRRGNHLNRPLMRRRRFDFCYQVVALLRELWHIRDALIDTKWRWAWLYSKLGFPCAAVLCASILEPGLLDNPRDTTREQKEREVADLCRFFTNSLEELESRFKVTAVDLQRGRIVMLSLMQKIDAKLAEPATGGFEYVPGSATGPSSILSNDELMSGMQPTGVSSIGVEPTDAVSLEELSTIFFEGLEQDQLALLGFPEVPAHFP